MTLATTTAATATAGTHPITATGTTAANYAITEVNGTLTVSQAALTVTANNQSKVYGAADPTLTYTPAERSIIAHAYSVITGVTLSTATGATATAGTHPITVSGDTAANYAITEVNGVLTVAWPHRRALSVSSALPVYGQLLTITATVTSPNSTPNSGTVTFYVNGVAQPNPVAVAGSAAWTTNRAGRGFLRLFGRLQRQSVRIRRQHHGRIGQLHPSTRGGHRRRRRQSGPPPRSCSTPPASQWTPPATCSSPITATTVSAR